MALASLDDINKYLPEDRIQLDDATAPPFLLTAQRIVKGNLSYIYSPVTLEEWASPETTPDQIRELVGKLIAGLYYRVRVSEETPELASYGQQLYNEAIVELERMRKGDIGIIGIDGELILRAESVMDAASFFPNNGTPAVFSMGLEF